MYVSVVMLQQQRKKKKENQSGYVDNIEESNLSVILHLLPLKLTSIIL